MSQFSSEDGHQGLSVFGLPKGVYPCGRLDRDSEGLLLLTDDGDLNHQLTDPRFAHPCTYWAQVERVPDETALARLRAGVVIEGQKTRPAEARLLAREP